MSVLKTFQCDVCFRPCSKPGNITIVLTSVTPAAGQYRITASSKGTQDIKPEIDQIVRHICGDCVGFISNAKGVK